MTPIPTTLIIVVVAAGAIILFILSSMAAIRKFYNVPMADEALVKTGGSKPVVSTGGGLWVIPMFHRVKRVSLRAVRIPIDRTGENALPTADKIMAEVRGELIVRVSPEDPNHVILAAQALGAAHGDEQVSMEEVIKTQVDSLVTDALRTAAFKKSFQELNAAKKEFADEVTQLLAEDLAKLGLTLTAVTIPHLKQGEFTKDAGDVFAAEGQRNVAQTIAKNRTETNQVNRHSEIAIQEQDVTARKRALELELERKRLEADNARQVSEYEAKQATETRKAVLEQEQSRKTAEATQGQAVATAQIGQEQKIKEAEIARDQAVTIAAARAQAQKKVEEEAAAQKQKEAEIARAKAVEAATIAKEQAINVASQQREQAIAEAEITKEVAIAEAKKKEAEARANQALAEAEKQRAEQSIVTVEAEAKAEREKAVTLIEADKEAGKQKIAADRDAYVTAKKAEAERDAALKRAEALRAETEGKAESLKTEAAGKATALTTTVEADAKARLTRATAEFEAADKEASAKIKLAEALLKEGAARAESERLMQEAKNAVSKNILMRDVAISFIEHLPETVREVMAPVAKVSDVRVLQVNGLGGQGGQATVPGTILGTGMALSGALPVLKHMLGSIANDEEVKQIAGMATDAIKSGVREVASALKEENAPRGGA